MAYEGEDRRRRPRTYKRAEDSLPEDLRIKVAETHTKLDGLCDFLMDNGQPGAISKLVASIEKVREEARNDSKELETRVGSLEKWKTWVNGAGAALSAVVVYIGTAVAFFWDRRP